IDAYNILRSVPPHRRKVTENEREQFLNQLAQYAKKKGHKLVVVFDGGPFEWPYKEKYKGLYTVYSGFNRSADDYIKEYIEKQKTSDLLLVSSDHDLILWAERFDIPSIGSFHFYQLVQEAIKPGTLAEHREGEVVKLGGATDDVDALMHEASEMVPVKSEDLMFNNRSGAKKKSSKKERALLKKLKKL
ncbi:MAG: NYN domain-containing protein, partial [Candidatus Babeliales bacterium]